MSRFLPENFLVATPMGLMRNSSNGGELKGPIMNPESSSFLMRAWTMRGSAVADCKLLQIMLEFGMLSRPGVKTFFQTRKKELSEFFVWMISQFTS